MEFIFEEGTTPQFYSETQTEQKYAHFGAVADIYIWPKSKMKF